LGIFVKPFRARDEAKLAALAVITAPTVTLDGASSLLLKATCRS